MSLHLPHMLIVLEVFCMNLPIRDLLWTSQIFVEYERNLYLLLPCINSFMSPQALQKYKAFSAKCYIYIEISLYYIKYHVLKLQISNFPILMVIKLRHASEQCHWIQLCWFQRFTIPVHTVRKTYIFQLLIIYFQQMLAHLMSISSHATWHP